MTTTSDDEHPICQPCSDEAGHSVAHVQPYCTPTKVTCPVCKRSIGTLTRNGTTTIARHAKRKRRKGQVASDALIPSCPGSRTVIGGPS